MRVIEPADLTRPPGTAPPTWAYGVTTVPQRFDDGTLARTLASLARGGFDCPRLFVDGSTGTDRDWGKFGLECTFHYPALRTMGNWISSLWELWVRNPTAKRFAIFQDDFVCVRNLRQYLDSQPFPDKSYLNLFTFLENDLIVKGQPHGWYDGNTVVPQAQVTVPGSTKLQGGKGAVALVFEPNGVMALLKANHLVTRPLDLRKGHSNIDGAIVTAMNYAGFLEKVHNPSLVRHIGAKSSMNKGAYPEAKTFPGEDFDAMTLTKQGV